MSDVQVSNARRIGFTALALVSFWILTFAEHSLACDDVYGPLPIFNSGSADALHDVSRWWAAVPHSPYLAVSMALAPTLFLSISVSNALSSFRDHWISLSACSFVATILGARWLAHDATGITVNVAGQQEASRPWLFLPLILTTAFVIFGAYRSAVRDAEVEAVGEDEEVTPDRCRTRRSS